MTTTTKRKGSAQNSSNDRYRRILVGEQILGSIMLLLLVVHEKQTSLGSVGDVIITIIAAG